MPIPDTQLSMVARLASHDDQAAWEEFVTLYRPFLYAVARRHGLNEANADDCVQRIMLSLVNAISKWQPDEGKAKFRSWLYKIARNHAINLSRSIGKHVSTGGTTAMLALQELPELVKESAEEQKQYRRELVLYAASRIRKQIEPVTWQAFWKTAVEAMPCAEVAAELSMNIASVYAARSRVLKRVRCQLESMSEVNDEL